MATKVGIPTHCKLQGFFYWYYDQIKRELIPAAANLDVTVMRLAANEFDAEKAGKELDLTELDPGKIKMELKRWTFRGEFLNMAKNVMGVYNDPLYDVINPDRPSRWVPPNDFEQRM